MIDTDYLEVKAPRRPAAIVREITREIFSEITSGPKLGPWESTPRGDGTFGVRRIAAGLALISDRFPTQAEAQIAADELNRALLKGDA